MPNAKTLRLGVGGCLAALAATAVGAEVLHHEALENYVVAQSSAARANHAATAGPLRARFNAFGRTFELELEPNARLDRVRRELGAPPDVLAYRGVLENRADSWVRIVTAPNGLSGLIFDGESLYGIEPPEDTAVASPRGTAHGSRIFRLDDVYVAPGTLGCSTAAVHGSPTAANVVTTIADELDTLAADGATLTLDIGAVADFEFSEAFGAGTEAALLARLNNVDGIFSSQVGVHLTVAAIDVFTSDSDPFTESDPTGLLDQVAVYRGATPAQDAQGLTHLFTGRDLDGGTVGIAFVGALCARRNDFDPLRRSFAAGVSEGVRGAVLDSLIAAHEIGHNFGAPHDAEGGSACQSTPATFLMAPSVTGTDRFSECSLAQMQPEISGATCIAAVGGPDLEVTLGERNRNVLAATSFDYAVDVGNTGSEPAIDAVLSVAFDASFALDSATPSAGSCSIDGSTVRCNIGDVPAGASRGVVVTMRARSTGLFAVEALAGADRDVDPSNDGATDQVTVRPVVNLVLSGSGGVVGTNQQTTLAATLDNAADFAASSVTLKIATSAGLKPELATLAGATCTVSGQDVICPTRSLAARSSASLSIRVTGLAAGRAEVSLDASSAEAELTPSDNRAVIAVEVTAAEPADESDGGGGAISWISLLVLLAALPARIRTRRGP